MKKLLFLSMVFLSIPTLFAQNPLINSPSLNADGSKIAFNYQGDIWTANSDGSFVQRITVHEGNDTKPLWSADGKQIAFQSNRFGNNDIFVMPANGGKPKRLTYHSASDYLTYFGANNEILFETRRNFSQIEREYEIQTIHTNGGTPQLKMNALGFDAVISPNQKLIAFVRGTCRIDREAYQGSANRDVWIYNVEKNTYHQITDFQGNDFAPQWNGDNSLYFLSAQSGRYNIHQIGIGAGGEKSGASSQITSFKDMGIFSYSISRNGNQIILNQGDKLFLLNNNSKKLNPVSLSFATDDLFDSVVRKNYSGDIQEVMPSPNGKLSAIVIRGEIFITENDKEKSRTVNVSNSPYRDRMVTWLNEENLIFISDRDGQNDLYLVKSNDSKEKNIFKTLKRKVVRLTNTAENESDPVLSPDGKKLVFQRGRGKLVVANISSSGVLSNEKTLLNGWDSPSGVSWSPDSNWLAYSLSDLDFNDEVYIHKADNSAKPINISMHPKGDRSPVWSADGSKIGFSSNRNNGDYDVWFVWLNVEDWQKTKEDWEESSEEKKEKPKEEKEDVAKKSKKGKKDNAVKKEEKPIQIDLEDMHARQVQVTNFTGGEFIQGFSKDGKTVYYSTGNGSRANFKVTSDLYKIKWDGKDKKPLTKGDARPRSVVLTKDKKSAFYISKGRLNKVTTKDAKIVALPIKAAMDIDYKTESNQIFEEAWSAIRDGFYDPNYHGRNWEELKNQYKPLAMKASTRDDFKAIFNKMLGQINASHMGMYRGENRAEVQRQSTGLLGIGVKPNKLGVEVESVTYQMPADRKVSNLKKGDIITAVNGIKVDETTNFYSLLNYTSNEKIYLEVSRANEAAKEIIIRPKSSNSKEKYLDWVKQKKALTDKYSNGKLGYIHIQGMNWTSFEEFERELTAQGLGKEGVVIDVRFNGGGWTTDYLMAVLTVRQHAYTIPRGATKNLEAEHKNFRNHYPFSERLPLASWTKPTIALCNSTSYSNAEIFSHAYKNLGLGTLVGQPTFGAVISTGATGLIDGSIVRMPFRGWYVKESDDNMDFVPAVPNILVKNDPDGKSKNQDKQLKRAVEELLKQVAKK